MNIAFVIFPDETYGGIARYMSMLAIGMRRNKIPFKFIIVDKGRTNKTLYNYFQYGMEVTECRLVNSEDAALKIIKDYDVVVYPSIKNAKDTPFFKHHEPGVQPWWNTIVARVAKPSVAFIHSLYDYTKYGPYADLYEKHCNAFIAVPNVAQEYYDARGAVDCYTLPLPIDCSKQYDLSKPRSRCIAITSRIDSVKRLHHIVDAMHDLRRWKLLVHSGKEAQDYFTMKRLEELATTGNVHFVNYEAAFDNKTLDAIYSGAALTYNATYFPNSRSGLEYATMEACLRGVVPLLTDEWIEPNPLCPPFDACYRFECTSKPLNSLNNNLPEVIGNIDVESIDYRERQCAVVDYIRKFDTDVIAQEFLGILEDVK